MAEPHRWRPWMGVLLTGALVAALAAGCLERREGVPDTADSSRCTSCHGDEQRAGDTVLRGAPPRDLRGATDSTNPGVGAHTLHLYGSDTHAAIACSECHLVPARVESPGHADDATPAELVFGPLSRTGGRAPRYDFEARTCTDSHCHGVADAVWTEPRSSAAACGSCHGLPPPAPHPQSERCFTCHGSVIDEQRRFVAVELHVDGITEVTTDDNCSSCHGSDNPAPPRDLTGETRTVSPGVGAHQSHLAGTPRSRAVPCGDCHLVPNQVLDAGHLDSPHPAEVSFSGAAVAFGGDAVYARGGCENTSCHGGVFPEGHASGGTNRSPVWTRVDGTQATCGACHALPPPAPHPRADLNPTCNACHENIDADNVTFHKPELHVDGIVTFTLP